MNAFETVTCGRCGGTGEYSYCPTYGRTCFKCAGHKTVLSKRGAEAQRYFTALCSQSAEHIKAGDKVRWNPAHSLLGRSGWVTVVKSVPNGETGWTLETDVVTFNTTPDAVYRVAQSKEDRADKLAAALAYQDTLTKAGAVAKRKAKAVAVAA